MPADYIRQEWWRQGHAVTGLVYTARGVRSENLEITLGGSSRATKIVLAGAHYDTVPGSPGADDNASGVAGLLELGQTLAGRRLQRRVCLVAFVNEEAPFFYWGDMGSRRYAKAARRRGDDIRLMMSLEMLGAYSDRPKSQRYPPLIGAFYPDRGNFIAFVSDLGSLKLLRRTVDAFRQTSDFPFDFPSEWLAAPRFVPGLAWSDHLSFWREGYPALMVTDTAFYRYAHYHRPGDTPDRLDYPRMARVVEGLAETIVELANGESLP